jgi:AsmA protein
MAPAGGDGKMLKKVLIGAGVLVGLVVIALIAVVLFVDVNKFKPEIERTVHDKYNRRLAINGDLSLSVFPRIAVSLPRTTLSERGAAERTFASLDGARVTIALWPLLSGRVEAGTVSIYGLTAAIERRKDGSTNFDDLVKGDGAAKPSASAPTGRAPQFEIGGIELTNASLTLHDARADNTITLTKLNLTTGPLAPKGKTPIAFNTSFSTTRPAAAGDTQLAGELEFDLETNAYAALDLDAQLKGTVEQRALDVSAKAGRVSYDGASGAIGATKLDARAKGSFGTTTIDDAKLIAPALAFDPARRLLSVGGLDVAVRGKLGNDGFELTLAAPKIDATREKASGERVLATVKLAGAQTATARLALEGLSGNAQQLAAGKLSLDAELRQGARRIVAALASPAAASLDAQTFALSQLAGNVTLEDPALPQKSIKLPISGKLALDAQKQRADLSMTAKLDESTLAAQIDVRGFDSPRLSFDASADKLNIDRYFPPAKAAPANDSADPRTDPKVDLSALKGLNLNGEARVGQLQARGIKASNVIVRLKAADGRLDVAPLSAALYGGTIAATANAIADGNRIGLDANLTGVSIEPLMKDALDRDLLEGRGNVKLAIRTGGATVGGLKRALNGSAALRLTDGAIKGINIAQKLRDAKTLLSAGKEQTQRASATEKTDFTELTASFVIKDGVAFNDDLDMKSPLLRLGGSGRVDVGGGALDYTAKVSVVGTLKGQDGRPVEQLRGATVPVRLAGPFDQLSYSIDWASAAQEALKSKASEKVKKKLAPQLDKQKEKLRDALKGVLPR